MKPQPLSIDLIKQAPPSPGIYIFRDQNLVPIYVGMSKSLKNRLNSYFAKTLENKTKRMMFEAKYLSWIRVCSEFEALLLEAKLVRAHMPVYNVELKDDKTPLYITITKDPYPRVITLRQSELNKFKLKWEFGPFVDGRSTKKVLRLVRKIFPYSTHKPQKRPCFYSQIGLCNPCPSAIVSEPDPLVKKRLTAEYKKHIRQIKKTLDGKLTTLRRELVREMDRASLAQNFEAAARTLKQIKALDYINTPPVATEIYLKDPNLIEDIRRRELTALKNYLVPFIKVGSLRRIECFDIAHLAGTYPTASMVTFINAEADKSLYRHFRVSREKFNNDPLALAQVLKRRQKYYQEPKKNGWDKPDLIIVDGGKGQVSEVTKVVHDPPVIGLAKRFEQIIIKNKDKYVAINVAPGPALNLLKRIRDESHRFARRYHHKLVEKAIRES